MNRDFACGLVMLAFCVVMYAATLDFPPPKWGTLGSATFPRLILYALATLSLILMGKSLRSQRGRRSRPPAEGERAEALKEEPRIAAPTAEEPTAPPPEEAPTAPAAAKTGGWWVRYGPVVWSFGLFALYAFFVGRIGYIIASLLFLFILQWVLGPRRWKSIPLIIIISVGTTYLLYFIFINFLKRFLPEATYFQ